MATIIPGVCIHLNHEASIRSECDAGVNVFELVTSDKTIPVSSWKRAMPCFQSHCSSVTCSKFQAPTEQQIIDHSLMIQNAIKQLTGGS